MESSYPEAESTVAGSTVPYVPSDMVRLRQLQVVCLRVARQPPRLMRPREL